ncbi:c-type cytochrome [Chryseolinea sp. H1M3-3]|uniref:c-type cytochrome n=1 Tax=Chryseolinea sp. H1M3-3 TaxID=3034144 RepID=UPI0023EC3982|nr:c-type cytochrome [Chryseolinea sp. H1M3-3]
MRRKTLPQQFILILSVIVLISSSCKQEKESPKQNEPTATTKLEKLKLADGFRAEHLYSPSANEQGSWVSMTFDNKGRLITSDQYGALYRLELSPIGSTTPPKIEKLIIGTQDSQRQDTTTLKIGMGYAQGLLYAFNSLYVMVNHNSNKDFDKNTGLYRLQDTDGDDQFDKITLLKSLKGEPGEHGPHSIILAPDKKSIYIAAGNHTDLPAMDAYRLPPVWKEDNLFPQIKDPRGHANNREAPGGWIAHLDSLGQRWELISAGYRNEFDIAFNQAGDLFTYDSDMEWDFGMPWYRPTRICHVTSGSEFGWRTGNGKWSPAYPDNLPPVLNIGQGSPTNLIYGMSAKFPAKYRNTLFAFDWSFGIIYAIQLTPNGSSYDGKAEEFLSGSPLPLTDGVIGPDGALYFLTGGRRLESDLYRVYYDGAEKDGGDNISNEITEENKLRRKLEEFHTGPQQGAVDFAWPNLKHEDRFVRYAARIAVEHQPVSEWQERALKETDPQILTQAIIALVRHGKQDLKNNLLQALMRVDYAKLSPPQQIDLLRAFELVFFRMGNPAGAVKTQVISYLDSHFPSNANDLNRMLSNLLVHIEAPGAVKKTLALLETAKDDPLDKTASASSDLILRNPQYGLDIAGMLSKVPPRQQTYYAVVLSQAKSGWTPDLQEKYFKWFAQAFTFKGGRSYIGFIDKARQMALSKVPKNQFAHFNTLSGDSLVDGSGIDLAELPRPKGPGRRWNVETASLVADSGLVNRNFDQGKMMFAATYCATCHTMQGEGGNIGPDLTQLGTRFTTKDMLVSILDPNKVVSDQYAATVFVMKDGSSIVGRLTNEDEEKYYVSQNPFSPQTLREIPKKDVTSTKLSRVSVMMPGLINSLNNEELKDLLAYLMAGGNKEHELYKNKNQAAK